MYICIYYIHISSNKRASERGREGESISSSHFLAFMQFARVPFYVESLGCTAISVPVNFISNVNMIQFLQAIFLNAFTISLRVKCSFISCCPFRSFPMKCGWCEAQVHIPNTHVYIHDMNGFGANARVSVYAKQKPKQSETIEMSPY